MPLKKLIARKFYEIASQNPILPGLTSWSGTITYNTTNQKFAEFTVDGVSKLFKSLQNGNLNHLPTDEAWWVEVSPSEAEAEALTTYNDLAPELYASVAVNNNVIDWSLGILFEMQLYQNTTLQFTNLRTAKVITLIVLGAYALTLPSGIILRKVKNSANYDNSTRNTIQFRCVDKDLKIVEYLIYQTV